MLIDDLIAKLLDMPKQLFNPELRPQAEEQAAGAIRMLQNTQPFVLSPQVVNAAYDMFDPLAVRASMPHLFLPAIKVWLEWDDQDGDDRMFGQGRHGILIEGIDIYSGRIYGFAKNSQETPAWDWDATFDFRTGGGLKFQGDHLRLNSGSLEGVTPLMMGWTWTVLAIINTPRVSEQRPADLSRLNKSRGHRPPLIQYKEVRLTVDAALCKPNRSTGAVATGEKAFHHVRTHMRLRNGKVQIVKPHWRGNRDKGIIKHRHMVQTTADEHGLWEGGPLPAPIILKPTQDA